MFDLSVSMNVKLCCCFFVIQVAGGCSDQLSLPLESESDSLFEFDGMLNAIKDVIFKKISI